jgi:VWFA-related protein
MRISAPLAASLFALLLASSPAARQAQPPAPQPAAPAQPPATPPPATAPAGRGQEPARSQQPPIRTGINFVRVDAIITDRQGNPVLDLKPEEFQISEDNKPQKIESFSVVKIDATTQADAPLPTQIRSLADEQQEAAKPETRLFVLLLDDYHVRRGNDLAVRKPLIDFIQNQLAPADMVALMYPLTPVTDLTFSRDRAGLISAVDHFLGRKFDYQPRNEFEEKYAYYPAATVEKVRNDVTMGALKGAAVRLGGLHEGRKSIIFVSEGFTSTLPPQLNDPVAAMPRVGNPARGNASAQGAGDTAEFFNSVDLLNDMRDVFDTANRHNTSIYAVDPRGLAAFEYDVNEAVGLTTDTKGLNATIDSLRILADNTDGRAIVNRNDLAVGMKQIIRDASGYYLLGYNSTQAPTDGRFHEIKVRVTRKGVDVRARKGYFAYTAEDAARASAPPAPSAPSEVTAALASIAEPPRGRAARFWIGMARGPNGAPRVTFAWEPMPPEDSAARGAEAGATRVMLTATAPDGRPMFRGRIPEEGAMPPAPTPTPTAGNGPATPIAAGASATFDAAPGQLQLRMVVENSRGQVMDSATQELTVPDFSKVQVSMSTPQVFKGRTARELNAIKANPSAPPIAERNFSRADRVLVRVDGYTADGSAPELSARLLNRGGTAMSDIPVQPGSPGQGMVEVGLSALAAGDYVIELNAKTGTGSAKELVAFKVSR